MGFFKREFKLSTTTKKLNDNIDKLKKFNSNELTDIIKSLETIRNEYKWIENKLGDLNITQVDELLDS